MTSLDPSHLPPLHKKDRASRGQAVYRRPGASGSLALPIPDLRFEQSYLRSIRRFIHDAPEHSNGNNEKRREESGKGKATETAAVASRAQPEAPGLYGVPLQIDWAWILWITTRDQVVSPMAQGAIWAIASLFLRPLLGDLGARVRVHFQRFWRSIFPPIEPHIKGGVGWMHDQFRGFTVGGIGSGIGTNIVLAK